jgi:membrane-associated phospholipid phosphatase
LCLEHLRGGTETFPPPDLLPSNSPCRHEAMENALTLQRPVSRDMSARASTLARVISDLFSPAALAVPCILLGVYTCQAEGTYWYALWYFLIAVPLPVAYVVWLLLSGRVTDFHLPDRRDRTIPFVVAIGCALGAAVALYLMGAPAEFLAPVVTALAQTMLLFLITLAWQISIHTSTTAGLVTFAALAIGGAAIFLALLVPLVAWARLYLGRHTLAQTVAGAALGTCSFAALFALRGVIW